MLGGYIESFGVMLAGRVVFGLGGESLSVSQSAIVSKWFKGKELAFALAINLSFSRLGSVINGWIVPPVYNHTGDFGTAFLVGVFVTIFSLVMAIGLVIMDYKSDKIDGKTQMNLDDDKVRFKDLTKLPLSFWLITGSCVLSYMAIFPFLQVVT